jgi:beta-galactosidase
MYIVTQQQADRIRAFVQNGGIVIAGFRLGVKDQHSRIVETPLPGLLRDVMGVELIDYQPIYSEKQSVAFTGPLAGPNADCHIWADILNPNQAEVLATYTGSGYTGKAAITSHTFGKGKAIYIGAHLEPADLARVLLTLIASSGVKSTIQAPAGVEVTSRRSDRGTLTYLLNHTATSQSAQITGSMKDILTNTTYSGTVSIDPYGVRVLQPA